MKLNGPAQILVNGAHPVPADAIFSLAAVKTTAMRSLVRLIIWAGRERRARE
jgi:hypothetical protein